MGSKTLLWILIDPERRREGDVMNDLELYPKVDPIGTALGGFRKLRANWKRTLAYSLAVLLLFGVAGYRWVTTVTPVDRDSAIELFRAERDDSAEAPSDDVRSSRASKRPGNKPQGDDAKGRRSSDRSARRQNVVAAGTDRGGQTEAAPKANRSANEEKWAQPQEGVYSWATDGYEEVGGARRRFPAETQRILTLNGKENWTTHHYFSEEREIWTFFHWGDRGAEITKQRNKVTFGPVTNDSTLTFAPPMLVGPKDLVVGAEWGDKWNSGSTHGSYSSKIFEHVTIDVGGEKVEAWGIAYDIELQGEQEGHVTAKVWLAPDHGLTVREYYDQRIRSSGATYHGEWTVELKSLQPQQ